MYFLFCRPPPSPQALRNLNAISFFPPPFVATAAAQCECHLSFSVLSGGTAAAQFECQFFFAPLSVATAAAQFECDFLFFRRPPSAQPLRSWSAYSADALPLPLQSPKPLRRASVNSFFRAPPSPLPLRCFNVIWVSRGVSGSLLGRHYHAGLHVICVLLAPLSRRKHARLHEMCM